MDTLQRPWSNFPPYVQVQSDTRKYWDNNYTKSTMMQNVDASAQSYKYCNELSFDGNKDKGQWYLPTKAQLMAISAIEGGIKKNPSYAAYSAFSTRDYWCSSEGGSSAATTVMIYNYLPSYNSKNVNYNVRCVRDFPE